ncbi:hypothetical protein F3Y22_tig00110450pilonHSYRG00968 [Hibiscus syriacus]|uniref:BED-type domain-containing protein n=1 Tax=Hibiscus syriacus TaxID=106335 RepID=A0A6A3AJA5_HIBSY|nr:hypothetical protein F3Y22_tig00110450pilonHSYRG00968 [Hibiscus syriacus]
MSDSPLESTEFESSTNTPTMESTQNPDVFITTDNEEVDAAATASVEHVDATNNEEPTPFTKRKRKKTSGVWEHFRMVKLHDGTDLCECSHCGEKFKKMKYGTTTPLHRHIGDCPKLKVVNRGQLSLKVQPGKSDSLSMVRNWKYDNAKMREVISHMIMVHELPFNFVEYGLFNVSELNTYLEEGVLIGEPGVYFDALGWWKENNLKFNNLSKMATNILAIPVTIVASESAFSAGGRVIDPHRSSLGTKMADMLVCGADWYRQYYGLEKNKNEGIIKENDVRHDVGEPSSKEKMKDKETHDVLENPTIEEREVSYPREYNYVKDGEIIGDPSKGSEFEMNMMRELSFFLGLQIKQRKDGIFINQAKYIKDMLKKFGLENRKPHATPMSSSTKLDKDEGAVKRIYRYLKDTPSLGLWYPRDSSFSLHAFSDANYGGCKIDRKITSGAPVHSLNVHRFTLLCIDSLCCASMHTLGFRKFDKLFHLKLIVYHQLVRIFYSNAVRSIKKTSGASSSRAPPAPAAGDDPEHQELFQDIDDHVLEDESARQENPMPPYFSSLMETLDMRFALLESHLISMGTQQLENQREIRANCKAMNNRFNVVDDRLDALTRDVTNIWANLSSPNLPMHD